MSARAANPSHALVCGLYSEDRADAKRDFGVLQQIVGGMLRFIEAHTKLHYIEFRPVARGVSGSYWKARKSKDVGVRLKRTTLLQEIATELLRGRVMFFHVDGDCAWKQHKRAPVRDELARFRQDLLRVARQAPDSNIDESLLDDIFIAVVPFYSIESWLYASTEHLRTLTRDARELERIAGWAADLGELDETPAIKLALPSIQDLHNHELAQHIPAATLDALGKSYTDTIERVRGSKRIEAGLAETVRRTW